MLLTDREWKEFELQDLFSIYTGTDLIMNKVKNGDIPIISHTAINNGIACWSELIENRKLFSYKKTISLADRGNFKAFVQKCDFYIGTRVKALEAKKDIPLNSLYFISNQIDKQSVKFSYGYNACDNVGRIIIMLPTGKDGNPDYDFMEAYVKEQERQKKQDYIDYAWKRIAELEYNELPLLSGKMWSDFRVLDLFDYKRGNQNNMNSLAEGNDMLISAKNINNGLKGFFVSNNDRKGTYQGNCITLNNDGDGGVGLTYYQPYKFLLDTHVYALYPKSDISKYAMLYITLSLSKQRVCFSHGYSISQDRLKKMKILLPTDKHGYPDYDYMEQYTQKLMLRKYQQFLDYVGAYKLMQSWCNTL